MAPIYIEHIMEQLCQQFSLPIKWMLPIFIIFLTGTTTCPKRSQKRVVQYVLCMLTPGWPLRDFHVIHFRLNNMYKRAGHSIVKRNLSTNARYGMQFAYNITQVKNLCVMMFERCAMQNVGSNSMRPVVESPRAIERLWSSTSFTIVNNNC